MYSSSVALNRRRRAPSQGCLRLSRVAASELQAISTSNPTCSGNRNTNNAYGTENCSACIEDRNGWIASRYGINSIPHLFFIDRNGKIFSSHVGYGDRTIGNRTLRSLRLAGAVTREAREGGKQPRYRPPAALFREPLK